MFKLKMFWCPKGDTMAMDFMKEKEGWQNVSSKKGRV